MLRKLRKASIGISALTIIKALFIVGAVAGAMLLYYDWTLSLTGAVPKVRFYKWADGTQTNTITLPYNIFADALLVEDNATYGIKNNDAANDYMVYLWAEAISDASKLANITIVILHPDGTQACKWTSTSFTNLGEANAVGWLAVRSTVYTIQVFIEGSSTVVVGDTVTCDLKLKMAA